MVFVSGPRQVGKTTLALSLPRARGGYLNWDVPADRQRVLGRFVRLDASRRLPGSGLGLSLVAAVAKLHGATLELTDNSPGLWVNLTIPRDEIDAA